MNKTFSLSKLTFELYESLLCERNFEIVIFEFSEFFYRPRLNTVNT